ncbi:MAG TPA: carbohydrate ABC transporter permease [Spirochaetia bacterium]|nr:carbohydrate ABC transporter permease [Spirochaetia bacterium]
MAYRIKPSRLALHLILFVTSFINIFPFIWLLLSSFKHNRDIITQTPTLFPVTWTLENYSLLSKAAPFLRFFLNSVIVSGVSTLFILAGCSSMGYIFAKYNFRGMNFFFMMIIATILIPMYTYFIPMYLTIRALGWVNTYAGLIYPLIIMSSGIFFLRQTISMIPNDLIDSSRIDGSSEFQVYWHVIIPLSQSALAAIAIVNWVFTWSRFLWPLIVASSERLFTMEIGLAYFRRHFIVEYGGTMAACVVTLLPVLIVFLVFRTRIIEGIAFTGMKS